MPSRSYIPPGAGREVITSSKIRTMPWCAVRSRSMCRKAGSAGMQPPPPIIGSTITAARRAALSEVPGIGPVSAMSLALTIDPGRFQSGRRFVAWLGLVPKQHSTGGRQRLGGISRAGNERLRQLLVVGAMAVIGYAKPESKSASAWLLVMPSVSRASYRPCDPSAKQRSAEPIEGQWIWPTRWSPRRRPGLPRPPDPLAGAWMQKKAAGDDDRSSRRTRTPACCTGLGAMLLDQPLAHAAELQTCAVHQQMHGLAVRARLWSWHFQRLRTPANRVFTSYGNLVDHCCAAWNKLIDQPWTIISLGIRS